MMSPFCSSPLWTDGHFSDCAQRLYLSNAIPLAACTASLLLALVALARWFLNHHTSKNHTNGYALIDEEEESCTDSEAAGQRPPISTTFGPRITAVEGLLLVADSAIGLTLLLYGRGKTDKSLPVAFMVVPTYLLALLAVRYWTGAKRPGLSSRLQLHSNFLYVFQWICILAVGHAVLVEKQRLGGIWSTAIILRFALFTLLCLVHFTAPRSPNQPASTVSPIDLKPGKDETASLFSELTYSWLDDLVWKAFRGTIEASDLYPLNRGQKSAVVIRGYRAAAASTVSLLWRLFSFLKYQYLEQGVWAALMSFTVFIPALLMRLILEFLEFPNDTDRTTIWLYVCGILVSGVITSVAGCQCDWLGIKISAKLRTVLKSEVYAKVLEKRMAKAPNTTIQDDSAPESSKIHQASDGSIVNLMSGDADLVSFIGGSLHFIWVSFPIQTTLATFLLYRILGPSGIIGVLIMVALLPLNILLSKKVASVQGDVLTASDSRIQSSNELINNIRTIKYLAWEASFKERVLEKRRVELKRLRTRVIWWSINMTIFHSLPFIVTIFTCLFYTVIWGNNLGTSTAFPALALFTIIRIPLDRMAASIAYVLQAHVSVVRIDGFLKERDTDKYSQLARNQDLDIGFEKATLAWPTGGGSDYEDQPVTQQFQLHDLNIKFRESALNVVCGPSGSGKSSLLLALLGEMNLITGRVFLPHEPPMDLQDEFADFQDGSNHLSAVTAYCPQEAWILNQTVQANILFGLPLNSRRYHTVLDAVALTQDLRTLDKGDETLAGENGNRLSGGQKQRVALARALYSLTRYVVLDDCLSAVDSRTANRIFFRALRGPLMQNRTCVLATHNTRLVIPYCDYVVFLDSGRVKGQGTAEDLISAGFFSRDMMKGQTEILALDGSSDGKSNSTLGEPHPDLPDSDSSCTTPEAEVGNNDSGSGVKPDVKPGYTEKKSEGAVAWAIIKSYLSAMGNPWYWIVVLVGFVAQQLTALGTNLWIKQWAAQYDRLETEKNPSVGMGINIASQGEKVDAAYYLGIYALICLVFALITFIRDGVTFYGALKASSQIYEQLLHSILHARLLFFDVVPLGQITNRFSNDIRQIDMSLAPYSISAIQLISSIVMVVVFISVALPQFLIVAVFVCFAYYCVTAVYINSSRDLKRIEAVAQSPLYQQLGETLSGYVSIRAYGRSPTFIAQNSVLIDKFNTPYLLLGASKEWLTFRIGFLSSLISFVAGAFVVGNPSGINAGTAGLVLTYAVNFTENVMWLVQIYSVIQQDFNSVDRVIEYTKVDQEAVVPPKKSTHDVPLDWPTEGHVRFQDYSTRYAPDLDPVLKSISFDVNAGKRLGIVGRTGAGKSTLTLALIRGLEAEGGLISIDGVDIASLTLERLRQIVTVVPQNPTLFDGSLRDNLDPLHRHTDDEMLGFLRTVHLVNETSSGTSQVTSGDIPSLHLDHPATSLSQGQRQLLCIARALLRRSRILVLDEATASVDHDADARIQAGLRASVAAGTTVLTIAHRLQTIADYDGIVVLDDGCVVEQGAVAELLQRSGDGAVFRRLCEESGDIDAIKRAAAEACRASH
ncbi:ATP-dependent bile acid permease [Phlyctema vagabunda]|uniref:ATP-dependent bile acid permease n=1 Tax=Phlyctema vagabunda TaxID=108571 RepID=A0ABR4PD10_9HELO